MLGRDGHQQSKSHVCLYIRTHLLCRRILPQVWIRSTEGQLFPRLLTRITVEGQSSCALMGLGISTSSSQALRASKLILLLLIRFDMDNSNVIQFFSVLKKGDRKRQLVYYQVLSSKSWVMLLLMLSLSQGLGRTQFPRWQLPCGQESRKLSTWCLQVIWTIMSCPGITFSCKTVRLIWDKYRRVLINFEHR